MVVSYVILIASPVNPLLSISHQTSKPIQYSSWRPFQVLRNSTMRLQLAVKLWLEVLDQQRWSRTSKSSLSHALLVLVAFYMDTIKVSSVAS